MLFVVATIGTALGSNFGIFVWWRILGGVGIGTASALSQMYIAELSPSDKRGKLVAVNQLTIVIGVLAAQLINWLIADPVTGEATQAALCKTWNGQYGWRWQR